MDFDTFAHIPELLQYALEFLCFVDRISFLQGYPKASKILNQRKYQTFKFQHYMKCIFRDIGVPGLNSILRSDVFLSGIDNKFLMNCLFGTLNVDSISQTQITIYSDKSDCIQHFFELFGKEIDANNTENIIPGKLVSGSICWFTPTWVHRDLVSLETKNGTRVLHVESDNRRFMNIFVIGNVKICLILTRSFSNLLQNVDREYYPLFHRLTYNGNSLCNANWNQCIGRTFSWMKYDFPSLGYHLKVIESCFPVDSRFREIVKSIDNDDYPWSYAYITTRTKTDIGGFYFTTENEFGKDTKYVELIKIPKLQPTNSEQTLYEYYDEEKEEYQRDENYGKCLHRENCKNPYCCDVSDFYPRILPHDAKQDIEEYEAVSYTHLTLPTNREV